MTQDLIQAHKDCKKTGCKFVASSCSIGLRQDPSKHEQEAYRKRIFRNH